MQKAVSIYFKNTVPPRPKYGGIREFYGISKTTSSIPPAVEFIQLTMKCNLYFIAKEELRRRTYLFQYTINAIIHPKVN